MEAICSKITAQSCFPLLRNLDTRNYEFSHILDFVLIFVRLMCSVVGSCLDPITQMELANQARFRGGGTLIISRGGAGTLLLECNPLRLECDFAR